MPPRKSVTTLDSFLATCNCQDLQFFKNRRFAGKRDAINYLKHHDTHCQDCELWDPLMEVITEADQECEKQKKAALEEFLDEHCRDIELYTAKLIDERKALRKDKAKKTRVNRQLLQAQEEHQAEIASKEIAHQAELDSLKKEMEAKFQAQLEEMQKSLAPKKLLQKKSSIKKSQSPPAPAPAHAPPPPPAPLPSSSSESSESDSEDSDDESSEESSDTEVAAARLPQSASKAVKKRVVKKKPVSPKEKKGLEERLAILAKEESTLVDQLAKVRLEISGLKARLQK